MTCKHVDIVAITVLLLGLALYSGARKTVPAVVFHKRVTVPEPPQRPQIRLPELPRIPLAFE